MEGNVKSIQMIMKNVLLVLLVLTNLFSAQVITDTIFGKPKFVREYVKFLSTKGPYTFMEGDDEYGHSTRMEPEYLRSSMSESWFETNFCRYTNNKTYYDENRNITREIWYYKSGDLVSEYQYKYDKRNRIIKISDSSNYSMGVKQNYYRNKDAKPFVSESVRTVYGEKPEKYGGFINSFPDMAVSEYDTIARRENVYYITNKKNIVNADGSYHEIRDSVFNKVLIRHNYYDTKWRMVKSIPIYIDNKGVSTNMGDYRTYDYDGFDRKVKETSYQRSGSVSYTTYQYNENDYVTDLQSFSKNRLLYQNKFSYDGNYIIKLETYSSSSTRDSLESHIVLFKYKFDKYKNWTRIIKNVNGKDLYEWRREIVYY